MNRASNGRGVILDGRYRLGKLLGEGGMSRVYLAEDLKLPGKLWAVKQVRLAGDYFKEAFAQEAAILCRLEHPCLPRIADYFCMKNEGFGYLVMDYIDGITLQNWCESETKSGKNIAWQKVLEIGCQLSGVLHYLHSYPAGPVIFRDLKPSNIMLDRRGGVWLIDFGIARQYKGDQSRDTVPIGTFAFAAPEQLAGKQSDHRTDLFALGAVFYYLLSGGEYAHVERKALTRLRPDIPEPFSCLIERLLERKPERRIQHAEEVLHEMNRMAEHMPSSANTEVRKQSAARHIVIGSLYPGSGATFVTIALAAALNHRGARHVVFEHAAHLPELFAILFGRKHAPDLYTYWPDRIPGAIYSEWKEGETIWLPMNPSCECRPLKTTTAFMNLYRDRICLHDISTLWEEEEIESLCSTAQEIYMVLDPFVWKLEHPKIRARLLLMDKWRREGKSVRFIANKAPSLAQSTEWLQSLPVKVGLVLPLIDYQIIVEHAWLGTQAQRDRRVLSILDKVFQPLIKKFSEKH